MECLRRDRHPEREEEEEGSDLSFQLKKGVNRKSALDCCRMAAQAARSAGPQARKQVLELSNEAAERIRSLLQQRDMPYLRLGVKTRGCNGLSYTLNYDNEKKRFDEEVEQHGVRILVDAKAVMHVVGTRMDYVDDDVRSEFVFQNPNAKGSCGCGESFTV